MKKEKNIKKIWLSIGSVALATLPFVSVVSCSNDNGKDDNSSSGDGNSNGSGNGGSTDNKPTVEQKYLSHSNTFKNLDYGNHKCDVLLDFNDAKQDILNNKIKWFNEDGTVVKYQAKITLEPGIVATTKNWSDIDLNAPFDVTLNEYGNPTNWYKRINEQVEVIYQFWKKENNQSYTRQDFEIKSITDDFLNAKDNSPVGYAYISLPLDKNIAVVDVLNEDIDNVYSAYCLAFRIVRDSITLDVEVFEEDWQNVKSRFSPIDTANNNLVVNGLKNSTLNSNAPRLSYKFASGNVTISKVE